MLSSNQKTITNLPTVIYGPDIDGAYLTIKVLNDSTIYLGDDNVSVAKGLAVDKNDGCISLFVGPNEILYGRTQTGNGKIAYLATLASIT